MNHPKRKQAEHRRHGRDDLRATAHELERRGHHSATTATAAGMGLRELMFKKIVESMIVDVAGATESEIVLAVFEDFRRHTKRAGRRAVEPPR